MDGHHKMMGTNNHRRIERLEEEKRDAKQPATGGFTEEGCIYSEWKHKWLTYLAEKEAKGRP